MILESRQIIHMGINYHILPIPPIDQPNNIRFQQHLLRSGIVATSSTVQGNRISISRKPQPLEIALIGQGTQPPVGQILILAPNPNRPLSLFISEVEAILKAFNEAWPAPNRQILLCDVALRWLYQSTSDHAFQEIWEKRLHQSRELLHKLGRPVHGGGLRFVMPPQQDDPESAQIELKIESFLQDTKKIFIEIQSIWRQPKPLGSDFTPADRLNRANEYVEKQVHAFMEGES
jgi:hypothetical protein